MRIMRHLSRLLLAVALAAAGSGRVEAALLVSSETSLGLSIGALPPITFSMAQASVNIDITASGGFNEPANIFTGSVMLPTALFTGVALINGLTITIANGAKQIDPNGPAGPRVIDVLRAGGGLGGPGPLDGQTFVNVLGLFNLAVPLGVVGSTGGATQVTAGSLKVAVEATGWTTGQVTVVGVETEVAGVPTTKVTITGYDNRTPGGNGKIQLISPFKAITNAAGNLPGIAIQTLNFAAPEPAEMLLVGAALASVSLLARWRLRK